MKTTKYIIIPVGGSGNVVGRLFLANLAPAERAYIYPMWVDVDRTQDQREGELPPFSQLGHAIVLDGNATADALVAAHTQKEPDDENIARIGRMLPPGTQTNSPGFRRIMGGLRRQVGGGSSRVAGGACIIMNSKRGARLTKQLLEAVSQLRNQSESSALEIRVGLILGSGGALGSAGGPALISEIRDVLPNSRIDVLAVVPDSLLENEFEDNAQEQIQQVRANTAACLRELRVLSTDYAMTDSDGALSESSVRTVAVLGEIDRRGEKLSSLREAFAMAASYLRAQVVDGLADYRAARAETNSLSSGEGLFESIGISALEIPRAELGVYGAHSAEKSYWSNWLNSTSNTLDVRSISTQVVDTPIQISGFAEDSRSLPHLLALPVPALLIRAKDREEAANSALQQVQEGAAAYQATAAWEGGLTLRTAMLGGFELGAKAIRAALNKADVTLRETRKISEHNQHAAEFVLQETENLVADALGKRRLFRASTWFRPSAKSVVERAQRRLQAKQDLLSARYQLAIYDGRLEAVASARAKLDAWERGAKRRLNELVGKIRAIESRGEPTSSRVRSVLPRPRWPEIVSSWVLASGQSANFDPAKTEFEEIAQVVEKAAISLSERQVMALTFKDATLRDAKILAQEMDALAEPTAAPVLGTQPGANILSFAVSDHHVLPREELEAILRDPTVSRVALVKIVTGVKLENMTGWNDWNRAYKRLGGWNHVLPEARDAEQEEAPVPEAGHNGHVGRIVLNTATRN